MNTDTPSEATQSSSESDPVNYLLGKINVDGTMKCLDSEDQPCIRFAKDPTRRLIRIYDKDGKVSLRLRIYLRSLYRYYRKEQHLTHSEIALVADYVAEDAYDGGRERVLAVAKKEGDYNYEAVCVFANTITATDVDNPGLGNLLLEKIRETNEAKHQHVLSYVVSTGLMNLTLRTSDLWKLVNSKEIETQVQADKATFYKALNAFSRRLDEFGDQFRKVGLDVTVVHKETGSWTTLVRRDEVFQPDATVLVKTDDTSASASVTSSGCNLLKSKGIDPTEDNQIQVEQNATLAG